jgi:hypothetical protein
MIKASRAGVEADLRPMIDNFIGFISTREFRLSDGTLARNRPRWREVRGCWREPASQCRSLLPLWLLASL